MTTAKLFLLAFVATITIVASAGQSETLLQNETPAHRHKLRQKLSHLRFYWQDVISGPNATAVRVAQAVSTNTSATFFGTVVMIDDALTAGPSLTSKLVGRAQGLYASASQEEVATIMAMNFIFVEGKHNGSTIAVLGRNAVFSDVREMPIVGGSGLFRFAKGYVQARTHWFDPKSGDATIEYNVLCHPLLRA